VRHSHHVPEGAQQPALGVEIRQAMEHCRRTTGLDGDGGLQRTDGADRADWCAGPTGAWITERAIVDLSFAASVSARRCLCGMLVRCARQGAGTARKSLSPGSLIEQTPEGKVLAAFIATDYLRQRRRELPGENYSVNAEQRICRSSQRLWRKRSGHNPDHQHRVRGTAAAGRVWRSNNCRTLALAGMLANRQNGQVRF